MYSTYCILKRLQCKFFPDSFSCPYPNVGERAMCHTDSGTQLCQGQAAVHNVIMVCDLCASPKRSRKNPAQFIIFLLHDTSEQPEGDDNGGGGWEQHAAEQSPFGALLLPHTLTSFHT